MVTVYGIERERLSQQRVRPLRCERVDEMTWLRQRGDGGCLAGNDFMARDDLVVGEDGGEDLLGHGQKFLLNGSSGARERQKVLDQCVKGLNARAVGDGAAAWVVEQKRRHPRRPRTR